MEIPLALKLGIAPSPRAPPAKVRASRAQYCEESPHTKQTRCSNPQTGDQWLPIPGCNHVEQRSLDCPLVCHGPKIWPIRLSVINSRFLCRIVRQRPILWTTLANETDMELCTPHSRYIHTWLWCLLKSKATPHCLERARTRKDIIEGICVRAKNWLVGFV